MSIGEKLLKLRKEKGYSQEEVAEKLKVTRQTISKWETDQSSPDFDKIVPLCNLYQISTDELLKGKSNNDSGIVSDNMDDDKSLRKTTAKVLSISIFLYFIAVIWIIFGIEVINLHETLTTCIFLFICTIATIILVYHFTSLPKDVKLKEKRTKEYKRYKSITSIVATLFTFIYLIISFMTMAWHITWIIWLVYAIVVEIIKIICNNEEDTND